MLKANYHTHTTLCDGANTPAEMAAAAASLGMEHLGFSGHMDPSIHMDWSKYVAEIRHLQDSYAGQLDILLGVELDALSEPDCCPGAEYRIGSTHVIPAHDGRRFSVDASVEESRQCCHELFGDDWYAMTRAYYETEACVVDATACTFVGHFDLVSRFNDELHAFDEADPRYLAPALECMEHLVSQDVPLEINCGAINRGRKAEPYPRPELLRALHDMGGEIFINSDAHDAAHLLAGFDQAIATALACGFTHTNILAHNNSGAVELRQVALDML